MAIENNYMNFSVKGSQADPISDGVKIFIPGHADGIYKMYFRVDFYERGIIYASGDKVFLVTTGGFGVELTKVADSDYWELTVTTNLFGAGGIKPGDSVTLDAYIVYQDSGSAPTVLSYTSRMFSLTVERSPTWNPYVYSGVLVRGWWRAWDITGISEGTVIGGTWTDKSQYEMDLLQATAADQPTYQEDGIGRPYVKFDGSTDLMAATPKVLGTLGVIAVVRLRGLSATPAPIFFFDETTDWEVRFTSTNLEAARSTTSQTAYALAENEWVAIGAMLDTSGNITTCLNGGAVTTVAAAGTLAASTFQVGKNASVFSKLDVHEAILVSGLNTTQLREMCERMYQYAAI